MAVDLAEQRGPQAPGARKEGKPARPPAHRCCWPRSGGRAARRATWAPRPPRPERAPGCCRWRSATAPPHGWTRARAACPAPPPGGLLPCPAAAPPAARPRAPPPPAGQGRQAAPVAGSGAARAACAAAAPPARRGWAPGRRPRRPPARCPACGSLRCTQMWKGGRAGVERENGSQQHPGPPCFLPAQKADPPAPCTASGPCHKPSQCARPRLDFPRCQPTLDAVGVAQRVQRVLAGGGVGRHVGDHDLRRAGTACACPIRHSRFQPCSFASHLVSGALMLQHLPMCWPSNSLGSHTRKR